QDLTGAPARVAAQCRRRPRAGGPDSRVPRGKAGCREGGSRLPGREPISPTARRRRVAQRLRPWPPPAEDRPRHVQAEGAAGRQARLSVKPQALPYPGGGTFQEVITGSPCSVPSVLRVAVLSW